MNTKQNLTEKDVADFVEKEFFAQGAKDQSFTPIVAFGKNSAIIHYKDYDEKTFLKDGEFALLDCGGYFEGGFATDITRTFYNERFISQKGLNELQRVLEGISAVKDNVGYCQGMNFLSGAFINALDSEVKAFMVINCLFKKYELCSLFSFVSILYLFLILHK